MGADLEHHQVFVPDVSSEPIGIDQEGRLGTGNRTKAPNLHISPISCCGPRYPRPDGAYSLQAVRRSVDYAFTAFHSVHPAIAASRRSRYEKR